MLAKAKAGLEDCVRVAVLNPAPKAPQVGSVPWACLPRPNWRPNWRPNRFVGSDDDWIRADEYIASCSNCGSFYMPFVEGNQEGVAEIEVEFEIMANGTLVPRGGRRSPTATTDAGRSGTLISATIHD